LTRDDSAEGNTVYTYDANDRLLSETLGSKVTTYTYHADGNTLTASSGAADQTTYTWDAQRRLIATAVTGASGTQTTTYAYDVDGNRISATTGGVETRYLVDANRPNPVVVAEYAPGSAVGVSYVYGQALISQRSVA
jgi:YD repeat-containing protein